MKAVYAEGFSTEDPLAGLVVGDQPATSPQQGWERVTVKAAALNHHDLWSLRGVGLRQEQLPMVLGCDAAGVTDDGREVIVHSVISSPDWDGDETLDPRRSLLSERYPGTLAEQVWVPSRNLIDKSPDLSFEHAACLPTSWLTAYRMLFTRADIKPGQTLLVQGASGGVASALISLASAAGVRVWVTSRTEEKREIARELGAEKTFESGARLPERVDVAAETVGEATWSHSLKCLKPGGTIVTCGATTGPNPSAELQRVFFLQLRIIGSTMGTLSELQRLQHFITATGITPAIDSVLPLDDAVKGFAKMESGEVHGKIVFTP